MDPSSLIFLAIIAMWAAYLLGHWVRRRDQLATARSIDRFSESMRVLERRTPTRPVSAARPTARAYVVARPVVGARSSGAGRRLHADARAATAAARSSRLSPALDGGASRSTSGQRAGRITREAARRRARLLLALVIATGAGWLLVATTALVWWPAALASALLGAVLVQLRRTARPARRPASGRSAARPRTRRSHSLASRVPAPARRTRHHQDVRAVVEQVTAARRADRADAAATATSLVSTPDGDPQLPPSASPDTEPTGSQQQSLAVGGWQPVPVPPPTYTLKPKARPAVRRPVPTADALEDVPPSRPSAPQPAPPAFDLDEILERRIAAGG